MTRFGKILVVIFAVIIIGVAVIIFRKDEMLMVPSEVPASRVSIGDIPVFKEGLAVAGVALDTLGYHTFSPDGNYFVFTGIKDGDQIPAKAYLVNLKTAVTTQLPGLMILGFEDARILPLFKGNDIILYDPETGVSDTIKTDGNIFTGTLSPDGTKYVFYSLDGIKLYDLATKTQTTIVEGQYNGATAWFSDSVRMLGYKSTGENLFEAGEARQFGVWNIVDKTFTPIAEEKISVKSVRNATWLVPEKIARVNAGYDDGSYDYLVDVTDGSVVEIGDTSGGLMGGVAVDTTLGLFTYIGGSDTKAPDRVLAVMYKGKEKISDVLVPAGYQRQSVQIVNENQVIYIRTHFNEKESRIDESQVVLLDFNSDTETVISELPVSGYATLSLSPDHTLWVATSDGSFVTGVVQ